MKDFRIRNVEASDAAALRELMADEGVVRNTLQLPNPSLRHWQKNIQHLLAEGCHQLACVDAAGRLLGHGGLSRFPEAGKRHCLALGMAVGKEHRGQGVGSALMVALMDLADNWLGARRIELTVYPDNAAGIALYRKFGFELEGRLRAVALRDGEYQDVLAMARLKEGWA
ncbi:GNAT family N-acetyltransferase [Chromobacterium sp. IIBBL 290-4]|uniref:GNAT family N-acetyltransferase n=1 Tax=Chromobacterium sp. IIBBL 290-4 TaxID=2953890 RepID=UPI0020B8BF9C|nr:GNAT family N-acetyltransferase [Chromobacterium sp. IIBBL 290-4]UTH72465.1 GNAT family N-acetyltransferase [Chromobacterium sp. IIBBL 290-4]